LELFLHQQTGVDEEAVLAYLSDGRRLRNDNIRDLAGAEDQVCVLVYWSTRECPYGCGAHGSYKQPRKPEPSGRLLMRSDSRPKLRSSIDFMHFFIGTFMARSIIWIVLLI
jgi:hypothetical protein